MIDQVKVCIQYLYVQWCGMYYKSYFILVICGGYLEVGFFFEKYFMCVLFGLIVVLL